MSLRTVVIMVCTIGTSASAAVLSAPARPVVAQNFTCGFTSQGLGCIAYPNCGCKLGHWNGSECDQEDPGITDCCAYECVS